MVVLCYMLSHGTSIACFVLVRTGTVICSTVCDLFPCVSFVVGNRSLWFSSYAWIIYYCNVGCFCVYIKNVILIESLFHCFISLLYSYKSRRLQTVLTIAAESSIVLGFMLYCWVFTMLIFRCTSVCKFNFLWHLVLCCWYSVVDIQLPIQCCLVVLKF